MSDRVSALAKLANHLADTVPGDASWMDRCEEGLANIADPLPAILDYFESLPEARKEALFDGSHDTGTHFKWLIARSRVPQFTLWLHEYKEAYLRVTGYAQVPHDHRYDIVSLILAGGYTAALWERPALTLVQTGTDVYGESDVMRLGNTAIHSLTEIRPSTLSLVIEGPRIKPYSTAYYPPSGEARIFPDFPARWPQLRARLAA